MTGCGVIVPVGRRDERLEHGELIGRRADGLMRLHEVLEVVDDRLDLRRGVDRLEHVIADEVVEVADRLHRHGLVEQLHRLLGADAEEAPHPAVVVRERVVDIGAAGAQP